MPNLDDELRRRMQRAGRRVNGDGLEARLHARRAHKQITQKVGRGFLAVAVLAGSAFGVAGLNRAFRGDTGATTPTAPATNGPIVVSFGDDGGTHLYLLDPTDPSWDPSEHRLTNEISKDTQPAVSPDGRTVAFVRENLQHGGLTVWTISIDGSDPRQISPSDWNANYPAWSPDGKQIAYIGGNGEDIGVYTVSVDGELAQHRLSPEYLGGVKVGLAWSPDADQIAVAIANGVGGSHISLIDLATGDVSIVTRTHFDLGAPSWSPGGRYLTFAHGGGVVILDLDTSTRTNLTTVEAPVYPPASDPRRVDSDPAWSPDGEWIAFERSFSPSEFFVYAMRPDGSDLHRIGLGGQPSWGAAQPATPQPSGGPVAPPAILLTWSGGPSGDAALLEGPLSVSNGCVGIPGGGTFTYLIWPSGSSIVAEGRALTVLDGSGAAVASIGDTIHVGGGVDSLAHADEVVVGGIPDACRQPGVHYWHVGVVEKVTAPSSPVGSSVAVPDVIGLSLPEARTSLESLGLAVGRLQVVTGAYTTAVVVEQQPAPGTNVASGSAVDLVTGPSGVVSQTSAS
jgi:hypothetical protein